MHLSSYLSPRGILSLRADKVCAAASCCMGGELEKDGPFGGYLDLFDDGRKPCGGTYEKAETEMVRRTVNLLLEKAGVTERNVDLFLGGDLLDQCTATGYAASGFDIPYMGLYGACSTFVLGLLTAALLIDGGTIRTAIVAASSHFCTAERQFRYPLAYGAVPSGTAQNTVTGCGAVLLTKADDNSAVTVRGGLYGIPTDSGISNASNMGAAMAPAAKSTLMRYFDSTKETPGDFDLLATGDLGKEGLSLLHGLLERSGCPSYERVTDCGVMIYDTAKQNVGCGGSGCGCSAVMTAGYILDAMKKKTLRRVGLAGTGALMSPGSIAQGLTIPAVCHLAVLESR